MGYPIKYTAEGLKDYLLKNPSATYAEMAPAFSGTSQGVKRALYHFKIKLRAIPGRVRPLKCSREKLEAYLSAHPEATAMEASKALNTSRSNVYSFAKRYGITFADKYHHKTRKPFASFSPQ
jgi:hypothetical protein